MGQPGVDDFVRWLAESDDPARACFENERCELLERPPGCVAPGTLCLGLPPDGGARVGRGGR